MHHPHLCNRFVICAEQQNWADIYLVIFCYGSAIFLIWRKSMFQERTSLGSWWCIFGTDVTTLGHWRSHISPGSAENGDSCTPLLWDPLAGSGSCGEGQRWTVASSSSRTSSGEAQRTGFNITARNALPCSDCWKGLTGPILGCVQI